MRIKALVAVRSGSQRVKNKNIRSFAGSNLLELKLEQLKRISELDGIVVNSNDDEMIAIAKKHGCETVKRESYYASNEVCMSDVYCNMAEDIDCDIVAYINVTNPLIEDQTISTSIRQYFENMARFDSLNTATYVREFMFLDGKPINYDLKKQPRSQDLPQILSLNFAINIIKREMMIRYKNIVGMNPFLFPINEIESLDIDTNLDFEFAEYVYRKKYRIAKK